MTGNASRKAFVHELLSPDQMTSISDAIGQIPSVHVSVIRTAAPPRWMQRWWNYLFQNPGHYSYWDPESTTKAEWTRLSFMLLLFWALSLWCMLPIAGQLDTSWGIRKNSSARPILVRLETKFCVQCTNHYRMIEFVARKSVTLSSKIRETLDGSITRSISFKVSDLRP